MYLSLPEEQLILPGSQDFYDLIQGRKSLRQKSNFRMVMRRPCSELTKKNDHY